MSGLGEYLAGQTDGPGGSDITTKGGGMKWYYGRMLTFDLETTAPQPELARIVQFGLAWVGGGEPVERHSSIVDPGVEIPAEASDVHGISTERARAEGVAERDACDFIIDHLLFAAGRGVPVVAFNAPYDLTVIDRRVRAHAERDPDVDATATAELLAKLWGRLRVADPRPIDSILDKYRRSYPVGYDAESAKAAGILSTRTLGGMCALYGVTLDDAHDASADAIAAGELLRVLMATGTVKRRRMDGEAWWAKKRWAAARDDLDALHALQVEYSQIDRPRFEEYKRREAGKLALLDPMASAAALAMADRLAIEKGWPVLEVMPHEVAP